MSLPGLTLDGSCRWQRSVRNASVPTVAGGQGPCCSGSWTGPVAEKAEAAVEIAGHLAVGSGVDAAAVAAAEGGCYCSLYSSRTTIRYCLATVGQAGRRQPLPLRCIETKSDDRGGDSASVGRCRRGGSKKASVADKSTCLPELTPAHTQHKIYQVHVIII